MENSQDHNEKSRKILQALYDGGKELDFAKTSELLEEFRILTREKTLTPDVLNEKCIDILVNYSSEFQVEAQKSLSNLILNYPQLRNQVVESYIECVNKRINSILGGEDTTSKQFSSSQQRVEVLYYDLRIVFLLSALCSGSRGKIRDFLLTPILKIAELEANKFSADNYLLIVESLKTLFNLTLEKCPEETLSGVVIKKLFNLVDDEHNLSEIIAKDGRDKLDSTDKLLVNLIHLLTNMPKSVYIQLSDSHVDKILNHLDTQLKTYSKQSFRDNVLPVLNVCVNICKCKEEVRKRWFDEIIASATKFDKRPEEYDDLKGRLVKLMTSVDVHIKDIAAEFLHALCGGDTEKLITYTGFGNSAAFLSSRGLLFSQVGQKDSRAGLSEDTDYSQLRNKIDPITGKLETQKKDPMSGMSQEEKEYHASELAAAITKLSNLGVVKPVSLDSDGKVVDLHPDSKNSKNQPKK